MFAITSIKGVGRRFANIVCKKAAIDITKRCVSELGGAEVGRVAHHRPTTLWLTIVGRCAGRSTSEPARRLVSVV